MKLPGSFAIATRFSQCNSQVPPDTVATIFANSCHVLSIQLLDYFAIVAKFFWCSYQVVLQYLLGSPEAIATLFCNTYQLLPVQLLHCLTIATGLSKKIARLYRKQQGSCLILVAEFVNLCSIYMFYTTITMQLKGIVCTYQIFLHCYPNAKDIYWHHIVSQSLVSSYMLEVKISCLV